MAAPQAFNVSVRPAATQDRKGLYHKASKKLAGNILHIDGPISARRVDGIEVSSLNDQENYDGFDSSAGKPIPGRQPRLRDLATAELQSNISH